MHVRLFFTVAICAIPIAAFGQDSVPTTAEVASSDDPYFALRRSKDRARKLTADRYLNLTKSQEWTDKSGKFRTVAKYVDHDPDLKWVKLEAASGRGKDRIVKQKQVPFEMLSSQCQSRVRQIARLKPRMDELIIAEAEAKEKDDSGEGASRYDESDAEEYARPRSRRERLAERAEDEVEEAAAYGANAIDPSMMGREALLYGASPQDGAPVDRSQWRESFAAFQQNFSIAPGQDGSLQLDWGDLHELRALSEALASLSGAGAAENSRGGSVQRVADAAASVGEVTWKAPFMGLSSGLLGSKPVFGLPPIAAPVSVQFVLADREHLQQWAKLQPGEMVQFHGQLKMVTPNSIVVWARMSDETVAAVDAQSPAEPASADAPLTRPVAEFVPSRENPR